jgi:two-component system chemotaxis response regulator CheY
MAADIMMVTPYRVVSELIRRVLSDLGFKNQVVATDADAALEKLRAQATCRLVIADWTIEPSGGLALLQQVRADEKLKAVRFVMISGTADKEIVIAAKSAGADDFIVKPFSTAILTRKLAAVLGVG